MNHLESFGSAWIDAWNSHDLDAVLGLYEDNFELTSPVLQRLLPQSQGRLVGKDAVRPYWARAFVPGVNLRFELQATFVGMGTVVVHYKGLRGAACAEFFQFSPAGLVSVSHAHESKSAVGSLKAATVGSEPKAS